MTAGQKERERERDLNIQKTSRHTNRQIDRQTPNNQTDNQKCTPVAVLQKYMYIEDHDRQLEKNTDRHRDRWKYGILKTD